MTQMIVNIILTLSLPITIWIGYWIAQFQIQRMPQQQRNALEQLSRMAVQYVEYHNPDAADKKSLATAFVSDLFTTFQLPVPSTSSLDIAIGSALFEVKTKTKKPSEV